jgi:hypothetical protein
VIHAVVRHAQRDTWEEFLGGWGRELAGQVRVESYERVLRARRVPAGTWIFCDHERLSLPERERLTWVWRRMARAGDRVRLLNHPMRVLRRYELLRTLRERGINDFDVQRLDEARAPRRFPVFLREEYDHRGPRSELLHSAAELEKAVEGLRARGIAHDRWIVTEYAGEPDARGLHRKYAAFNVGGRIVPAHVLFGSDWVVKRREPLASESAAEEQRYVEENPHADALRGIFELAGIEWGRVDYGLVDGRIQVYEINTNPMIVRPKVPTDPAAVARKQLVTRQLVEALRALDVPASPGGRWIWMVPRSRLRKWIWKARARWRPLAR